MRIRIFSEIAFLLRRGLNVLPKSNIWVNRVSRGMKTLLDSNETEETCEQFSCKTEIFADAGERNNTRSSTSS